MARYSKEYGEAFAGLVELALGIIYKHAKNFLVGDKHAIYQEYNSLTGDRYSKKQVANHFYELKRQGYIESVEWEGEKAIRLTGKAKIKLIENITGEKACDQKNRYVSFDIPERLHNKRDLFRRAIKRMGFRQVQQSLWVINKNVGELVEIAASEYKVEEYVAYIVAESSNIDEFVKKIINSDNK